MTTKRKLAVCAAAALAASLFSSAPAASAARCAFETVALETFKVKAEARAKTYEIGDTALIDVKITRPDDDDPLGLGIPVPTGEIGPVEGARVGVGLRVSDGRTNVFLFGLGVSDSQGKSTIRIKIRNYAVPGVAAADAYAYLNQVESPCLTVQEFGYTPLPKAFTITR